MSNTHALISLLDEKKIYIVKDGALIQHELPDYGEVKIIMHDGKVDRLEDTRKRKV